VTGGISFVPGLRSFARAGAKPPCGSSPLAASPCVSGWQQTGPIVDWRSGASVGEGKEEGCPAKKRAPEAPAGQGYI